MNETSWIQNSGVLQPFARCHEPQQQSYVVCTHSLISHSSYLPPLSQGSMACPLSHPKCGTTAYVLPTPCVNVHCNAAHGSRRHPLAQAHAVAVHPRDVCGLCSQQFTRYVTLATRHLDARSPQEQWGCLPSTACRAAFIMPHSSRCLYAARVAHAGRSHA